ncbi:hypothetical protein [Burkholderia vietnamiensis]|nr:hypothetical protein [Burkholderia vietnamiensis]
MTLQEIHDLVSQMVEETDEEAKTKLMRQLVDAQMEIIERIQGE